MSLSCMANRLGHCLGSCKPTGAHTLAFEQAEAEHIKLHTQKVSAAQWGPVALAT